MALLPSADDVGDFEGGERLPVAGLAAVVLAAAELEDDELLAEALADDLGFDLGAADERLAELDARALAHEEHAVEGDRVAHAARELLDPDLLPGGDPVLLS